MPLEPQDRILRLPFGFSDRLAVLCCVALVVPAEPVRQALEEKWAATCARRGDVAPEGLPHGKHVVAVDGGSLDVVGRDHVAHPLDIGVRRARRELCETVVLAHHDQRQLPKRREVDGLVEVPCLDSPVAEEHDRHCVVSSKPRCERTPERDRDVAAHHAGGPHEPVLDIDEMHRATEPTAEPAVASHELRHRAFERGAFRDRVAMRAVS